MNINYKKRYENLLMSCLNKQRITDKRLNKQKVLSDDKYFKYLKSLGIIYTTA